MSVIIRLQNLPWSANALDIRQFFQGLSIPEGGVHIVGGEQGDAFIAFSTDEDARQAFNHNGGKIKEIQVKLMLSSRTEMQKVIESARNPLAAFMQAAPTRVPPAALPSIIPAAVPALVPALNNKKDERKERSIDKDKNDKRDKRRSRSRSRDRKERDRRDRRRRDRSRSRSRDRRDRRRRDRSRSRDRTRSKDRDRRSRDRKRSEDRGPGSQKEEKKIGVWEDPIRIDLTSSAMPRLQNIPNTFIAANLEEARRNLNALNSTSHIGDRNGFQNEKDSFNNSRSRDSWPPAIAPRQSTDVFGRSDRNMVMSGIHNKFSVMPQRGGNFNDAPLGGSGRPNFNRSAFGKSEITGSRFNPPDRPDRHSVPEQLPNCCVQLRPYYGGYSEVRSFFKGIFINSTGIKFVNDDYGKRTGIIYIRFAYPEGKDQAMKRAGTQLKGQMVEISHLADDVFEHTIDRYKPGSQIQDDDSQSESSQSQSRNITKYFNKNSTAQPYLQVFTCLLLEDLPTFVKEQDILKLFSDYSLMSIILINRPRHHVAYVKFSNADDAKKAQEEKSKHAIDGKPITVKPCTDEEFEEINIEHNQIDLTEDTVEEPKTIPPSVDSDCISLAGLPTKTTDRDIRDFFSDIAIIPARIHLLNNNLGFTGEAICEFATLEEAETSLEKDGVPLGSGVVTVKSMPREELEKVLSAPPHPLPSGLLMNPNRQLNPIRPFFPPRNNNFGPRGPLLMGPRPLMRRFLPPLLPGQHGGDISPPGCTVLMENVPYKSGLDEILKFFNGHNVSPDNILRRYNENGTPSGEAKVIFNSPNDAFEAIEDKNRQMIRERVIFLSQC